jgi:hypothetical protein
MQQIKWRIMLVKGRKPVKWEFQDGQLSVLSDVSGSSRRWETWREGKDKIH